jgi:hypothetical protein
VKKLKTKRKSTRLRAQNKIFLWKFYFCLIAPFIAQINISIIITFLVHFFEQVAVLHFGCKTFQKSLSQLHVHNFFLTWHMKGRDSEHAASES